MKSVRFFYFLNLMKIENNDFQFFGKKNKMRSCSTYTTLLWTQCKKSRTKKIFVENLNAAYPYSLHYYICSDGIWEDLNLSSDNEWYVNISSS